MPSIKRTNKILADTWELHEEARSIHASMQDSDDDSPIIKEAENTRKMLEPQVKQVLRHHSKFSSLSHQLPRASDDSAITRRNRIKDSLATNTQKYNHTSFSRQASARTSSIVRYAFNDVNNSDVQESDPLSVPCFTWMLHFKKINLEASMQTNIWIELGYNETDLRKWWWRNLVDKVTLESHAWSDMKRLSRRVVIQILERIGSPMFEKSRHITRLKMVAERAREIVLYQTILCYNLPLEQAPAFQELIEYTVPIVFLVSKLVDASSRVSSNLIAENYRIGRQLESLDPYVRELRERCYLLGNAVNFDVSQYEEEFNRGAIYNFEKNQVSSEKNNSTELDQRLVGRTKKEYANRISNIRQKQIKVNEAVQYTASHDGDSQEASDTVEEIQRVLEEQGLRKLTDLIPERLDYIGSGAYADVYEARRSSGTDRLIAIKVYRTGPRAAVRMKREAGIWTKLQHANIARLVGFTVIELRGRPEACLVSQLCHSDLKSFVKRCRLTSEASGVEILSEKRKMELMRDIAFGLDYLHASGIAHGDLRAANVLITNDKVNDPDCRAILNDFGMSEYDDISVSHALAAYDLSSVNQKTHENWLAPELFDSLPKEGSKARVTMSADIYALGVVYLEVIYEKDPYEEAQFKTNFNIPYLKSKGELPAKKENLHPANGGHWSFMERCWERQGERWNIVEAACEILTILDKLLPPTPADWVSECPTFPEGFQWKM